MWWPDRYNARSFPGAGSGAGQLAGLVTILAMGALLGGCFQPLYADKSLDAGAGGPNLRGAMAAVDVKQIDALKGSDEARLAVEIRNSLIYDLTGGGPPARPTHSLAVRITPTVADIIVDVTTTRPAIEDYGINATYILTEIASGKQVVSGQTVARVSYDIPGQEQRFARIRGLRDAETRAAKVIADNIRSRLASYFAAGT
jgi:LPS-assembly lipoprotein